MNRLFFRPEQAGMTKTDAAAQTLAGINPDVALESFTSNITTLQACALHAKWSCAQHNNVFVQLRRFACSMHMHLFAETRFLTCSVQAKQASLTK